MESSADIFQIAKDSSKLKRLGTAALNDKIIHACAFYSIQSIEEEETINGKLSMLKSFLNVQNI